MFAPSGVQAMFITRLKSCAIVRSLDRVFAFFARRIQGVRCFLRVRAAGVRCVPIWS